LDAEVSVGSARRLQAVMHEFEISHETRKDGGHGIMKKVLGLALALTLMFSLSAAAEQAQGTIYSMNPADHSIVLDNGTRLWVSEGQFADLSLGNQVQAAYETKGDKKIVVEMARPGLEGTFDRLNSYQAPD
jgi:Protein of unknown function (DUF1344)